MKYYSTKKFGPITTGHRQWKDTGHCKYVHGYARHVEITFGCSNLDDKQWVMDFGGLKEIKNWLNEQWDHRLLIASDDPLMSDFKILHEKGGCNLNIMDIEQGWGPGIEASCKFVYDYVNQWIKKLTDSRVWVHKVQIWEHENNSAFLTNE